MKSLKSKQWAANGRESITASFDRKQLLAPAIYSARIRLLAQANSSALRILANTHWRTFAFSLLWARYWGSVECWGLAVCRCGAFPIQRTYMFIRPLSPCPEVSPAIPIPRLSSLPAFVALKL